MEEWKLIYSGLWCYVSMIFMEAEVIDNTTTGERKTIRQVRRLQAEGETILAVVLETEAIPGTHSKTLLDNLEGLPRTLDQSSWITIDDRKVSLVIHAHLTPTDKKELLQRYSDQREMKPERTKLEEATDSETMRKFLRREAIKKVKRE